MTFQIQIYWRVMAPFFLEDFGLEEKPNFKKKLWLGNFNFWSPEKKSFNFWIQKKLDTKKINLCGGKKTVKSEIEKKLVVVEVVVHNELICGKKSILAGICTICHKD